MISACRARFIASVSRSISSPGVLRGVPHRGHPRPLLRGGRLEQRAVQLGLDVDRQQPLEDLLRLGLVDEVAEERLPPLGLLARLEHLLGDRQHVLLDDLLDERRDEVVVDDDDAVDLLRDVELGDLVRERLRVGVGRPVAESGPRLEHLEARGSAASRRPSGRRRASERACPRPRGCRSEREGVAKHLRVERAREPAVAGQRQDRDRALLLAPLEQRQAAHGRARPGGADHQLHHPVGVRAHRLDPRLRPAQPRAGDELHRLRDLARVPDRPDPALEVLDRATTV